MGRKKNPEKPPRVLVSVRYTKGALAVFDRLAAEHELDRSEVIRRLAARGWRSLKPGEAP